MFRAQRAGSGLSALCSSSLFIITMRSRRGLATVLFAIQFLPLAFASDAVRIAATPIDGKERTGESVTVESLESGGHQITSTAAGTLSLYTANPNRVDIPAVIGKSLRVNDKQKFEPRFPLQTGIQYFVAVGSEGDSGKSRLFSFSLPKPEREPTARVAAVFPSADTLPENLLKFYVHFSEPMSAGDSYKHVRLLDERGDPVELPFLELGEELWDGENRRFTLLFDPGRVKSGLLPRRESGAVLESGKRYTLEILNTWRDANGQPLKASFRKSFQVGKPDGESPRVEAWKIASPRAGALDPLEIEFEESLDEALLHRLIEVRDPSGNPIEGTIAIDRNERRWRLTPARPWGEGRYQIQVRTLLEDVAGNSVGRPFEVDLEASDGRRPEPFVFREFTIR